jgi:acetyl esterase/lipase
MTSKSLLDPQLAPLFVGVPNPSFSNETLPMLRQVMAGTRIECDGLTVAEHHVDRTDGSALRLVVLRPERVSGFVPVVLHCHPGGWILGTPETSAPTLVDIANNVDCMVVSVDYRLAPEHPFPAAHDDMVGALSWIRSNAQQLEIDTGRIILAGESAGANIAAGVALRCRDEGDDQGIIGLSLVYAPLDDRTTAMPPHPYAGTIGLGADQMRYAWASYLGDAGTHDASPYAAPTRAENLGGLPPVFLAAGALDPVIEENLEFAQRLIREGVATTLHVFSGAPHGFDRLETAQVTAQLRSLRNDHLKRCIQP